MSARSVFLTAAEPGDCCARRAREGAGVVRPAGLRATSGRRDQVARLVHCPVPCFAGRTWETLDESAQRRCLWAAVRPLQRRALRSEPTSDFRRPSRCCCEPKADLSARRSSCGTISSRGPCGPLTGCGSAAGRRCTRSTAASTAASRTARADGGGCLVRSVAARGDAHTLLGQHAAHRLDPEAVLVTVDEGH